MTSLKVGLTGGLAAGKSTVAAQLAAAGFQVVDADRLVAELYRPGGGGAELIGEQLGPEMLRGDGTVDKVKVARAIFHDAAARERLERAVHPLVRQRFRDLCERSRGVCVLEASKLVEAGYAPDFDLVVTVEASEATRIARARERGLDELDARARIAAQTGEPERRAAAQFVIQNDGDRESLQKRVAELIGEIERRATAR